MLEKISLNEKQYDNLTKGLAIGVGLGIFIGTFTGNVVLTFAAGGVIGIIGSLIYSYFSKTQKAPKLKDNNK